MFKIKAFTLTEAVNLSSSLKITLPLISNFNLSELQSYCSWQNNCEQRLKRIAFDLSLHHEALKFLLNQLKSSQSIYIIKGNADLYVYFWPNNEPKLLPIWSNSYLIQPDLYWFDSYPFLQRIGDIQSDKCRSYFLNQNTFREQLLHSSKESLRFYLPSHNNHFGHFLLDNLPLLPLVSNTSWISGLSILPFPYKSGILDLINCFDPVLFSTNNHMIHNASHYRIKSLPMIDVLSSNIFTNAFLVQQFSRRIVEDILTTTTNQKKPVGQQPTKIFLIRSGKFTSRIANLDDMLYSLNRMGFIILDPTDVSLHDLVYILSRARIIISESGSTTLNALLFAHKDASIISLNPKRLFISPCTDMIHSGLPYLLAFADRVRFVLGETVYNHNIQSSDICQYDISEIVSILKEYI